MQIHVNGELKQFLEESSLLRLLAKLEVDYRTVAVELSGTVVPRSEFGEVTVVEGDRVEIVRFVQGG